MLAIVEFYLTDVDGLSNLCQVDDQLNVGETQMTKFSSNRPVKSTLTADQSLLKPSLIVSFCSIAVKVIIVCCSIYDQCNLGSAVAHCSASFQV